MSIHLSEKHGVNPSLMQCFYCLEEAAGIALLGRLPNDAEAPRQAVFDMEPCAKCKAHMQQGVILISVKDGDMERVNKEKQEYDAEAAAIRHRGVPAGRHIRPFIPNPHRTGGWWVMRAEAVARIFKPREMADYAIRARWIFIEDAACKALGLVPGSTEPADDGEAAT